MLFYMGFQWSGAMKNGSMTYFCKWVMDNTFFGTADAWGRFTVPFKYHGCSSDGCGSSGNRTAL